MMTIRLYNLLCFIGSMNDDLYDLFCFIGSMNDGYTIIRFYRKYE